MLSDLLLDWVRLAILTAAQLLGGSIGTGILAVSVLLRAALLPLTIRLARKALAQQAMMARLEPQLRQLHSRYAEQPERLAREMLALYRREGIRLFDPSTILGTLVQLPILGGLFAAVRGGLARGARFLWVSDLARPDLALAVVASVVTGLGAYLSLQSGVTGAKPPTVFVIIALVSVVVTAWLGGAGFALSLAGTGLINSIQAFFLRGGRGRAA